MFVSFLRPGLFASLLVLALAGIGVALAASGQSARDEQTARRITGAYTVRVVSPSDDQALPRAAAALRTAPGVSSAIPMDAARAAQLLTRWGGRPVDAATLPTLRLIEVRAVAHADRAGLSSSLADALKTAGVTAEIYDAGPGVSGASPAVRIGRFGGFAAAIALALAISLVAAAAAAADGPRAALWADHGGARDETLAAFGRAGAEIAFIAGVVAVIIAFAAAPGMRLMAGETISYDAMIRVLSPWDVLITLAAPLAAGLAGMLGARMGAAQAFDAADRLG